MIADGQQKHMTDKVGWRTVQTDEGEQSWGPERPSFSNGALCYLNKRDAKAVERKVADGKLNLMSKHIVISAEYVPVLCEVYKTVYAMWNTERVMNAIPGRKAYTFVRAALLCDFDWYGTDSHGPIAMKMWDVRHKVEWASAIDRFEDRAFVADERPGKPTSKRKRLPIATVVNKNYREAGQEPNLTDEALADVLCMAMHAAAAALQERAEKKSYTKPLIIWSVHTDTVSTVQCTPAHRYTSPCTT